MIGIEVFAKGVLDFLKGLSGAIRPHVSRALNESGDEMTESAAAYIAQQTGFSPEAIKHTFKVKQSTPDDLDYHLDTSGVMPPSGEWERPWDTRDNLPDARGLVKLIDMSDDRVCPICTAAVKNNPYTAEEIIGLRVHGYDGANGIVHYGCRCSLGEWFGDRPMPITFGRGGAAPPELFNVRKIGSRIAAELKTFFKRGR